MSQRKALLLQGFSNAGVSSLEAEQVVVLYLEQQFIASPPPLPPRPTLMESAADESLTSLANRSDTTNRQILVIGHSSDYSAIVAQYYLKLLRAKNPMGLRSARHHTQSLIRMAMNFSFHCDCLPSLFVIGFL